MDFVILFTSIYFFFSNTATTVIYTLSLHDALPIFAIFGAVQPADCNATGVGILRIDGKGDRKSTRLNSSHRCISYAVFCLKKKKKVKVVSGSAKQSLK